MLRLKEAINDCGIQQTAIVEATGFGKTQVSLSLKTGKLPADAAKFTAGVIALVNREPKLIAWLDERSLAVPALLDDLAAEGTLTLPTPDPEALITTLAGRVVIGEKVAAHEIIKLTRVAHYLLGQIRFHAGLAAPEIRAEAAAILGWQYETGKNNAR